MLSETASSSDFTWVVSRETHNTARGTQLVVPDEPEESPLFAHAVGHEVGTRWR